jgi:hypothetical protein
LKLALGRAKVVDPERIDVMNLQTPVPPSGQALLGSVRHFGPHGVLYEVVKIVDDRRALIRVIDTGEETSYSIANILNDPKS